MKTFYQDDIDKLAERVSALESFVYGEVCVLCGDKAEMYINQEPYCVDCAKTNIKEN